MRLSKIAYYLDFYLCLALIAKLSWLAGASGAWVDRGYWLCFLGVGAAAWTFIEYAIHKWVYHHTPYFSDLHGAHHDAPDAFVGAPPIVGIVLIFAIFYAPLVIMSPIAAGGLTAGVLAGYVCYMAVHHAAHYWKPSPASPLYALCRHHAMHHYRSDEGNFGITTSFWDHVFGTVIPARYRADTQIN
jgi:sterol desaturase/sphingolipid hydroxylase (fatty acid hydroxylase superfamily)